MKPFLYLQPEGLSPSKKPVLKPYKSPRLIITNAMANLILQAITLHCDVCHRSVTLIVDLLKSDPCQIDLDSK